MFEDPPASLIFPECCLLITDVDPTHWAGPGKKAAAKSWKWFSGSLGKGRKAGEAQCLDAWLLCSSSSVFLSATQSDGCFLTTPCVALSVLVYRRQNSFQRSPTVPLRPQLKRERKACLLRRCCCFHALWFCLFWYGGGLCSSDVSLTTPQMVAATLWSKGAMLHNLAPASVSLDSPEVVPLLLGTPG